MEVTSFWKMNGETKLACNRFTSIKSENSENSINTNYNFTKICCRTLGKLRKLFFGAFKLRSENNT